MTVYLDCNATTPIEPEVLDTVVHYLRDEYGNAGSRTHEYGLRAKEAVELARQQVAAVVAARPEEVVFTSGATESNNLALLGLAEHGFETGKRHVVSTAIEHKAVLEPLRVLEKRGFEVTLVPPTRGGWVEGDAIMEAMRDDTLLVSVMQVNNETGVIQPILAVADALRDHSAFFHVDAAQGFGKDIQPLRDSRIDLMSISGHKIHGPMGVGALVARRRRFERPPIRPLLFGGGQERGLRSGTLPVALVAGLGVAANVALRDEGVRRERCLALKKRLLDELAPLDPHINGDPDRTLPHVLSLSIPGLDSEAAMVSLKGVVAVSNGSACTSQTYSPSHVLMAMGLPEVVVQGALRLSWCHMTPAPDFQTLIAVIRRLL